MKNITLTAFLVLALVGNCWAESSKELQLEESYVLTQLKAVTDEMAVLRGMAKQATEEQDLLTIREALVSRLARAEDLQHRLEVVQLKRQGLIDGYRREIADREAAIQR